MSGELQNSSTAYVDEWDVQDNSSVHDDIHRSNETDYYANTHSLGLCTLLLVLYDIVLGQQHHKIPIF